MIKVKDNMRCRNCNIFQLFAFLTKLTLIMRYKYNVHDSNTFIYINFICL